MREKIENLKKTFTWTRILGLVDIFDRDKNLKHNDLVPRKETKLIGREEDATAAKFIILVLFFKIKFSLYRICFLTLVTSSYKFKYSVRVV